MGIEIERRFLVENEDWRKMVLNSEEFMQGYLIVNKEDWTIRVRIINNNKGLLTLKSPLASFINHEFEYQIPNRDAFNLLKLSKYQISKTRYQINSHGKNWVIDSFHNANSSLTLAEIELENQFEEFIVPSWCGKEITGYKSLSNASLAQLPISKLSIQDRMKDKDP
tara:strand:+ start:209 stop:709 length:501 start_codon:yes stop_codon:yes gene_type:complete